MKQIECNNMIFKIISSKRWDACTNKKGRITFYFGNNNRGLDRRFTANSIHLICELIEHEWIHRLIIRQASFTNGKKHHFIMKRMLPWNRVRGLE